ILVFSLLLLIGATQAAEQKNVDLNHWGYGYYYFGQIMEGAYRNPNGDSKTVSHVWDQETALGYGVTAVVNERNIVTLASEIKLLHSFPQRKIDNFNANDHSFNVIIYHAEGVRSFGDPENPYLELGVGYWPYKYNKDVRNLGEYLFRSEIYAPTLINYFDFPRVHVLGFRASGHFWNNRINTDVLLTSEVQTFPEKDLTLSWLGSVDVTNYLQFGAGISFSRLISMDENRQDSIPFNAPENEYNRYITGQDTAYVPFSGTKLMARAALDIRKLLGSPDILGENDLKVYTELAVLGTKNYPDFVIPLPFRSFSPTDSIKPYTKLSERIPIMVGINLPAFRILDVLSFEFEYFKFNEYYSNSLMYRNTETYPLPIPDTEYQQSKLDTASNYPVDLSPYKWSLYGKKTVSDCFDLIGMVGRDHVFTRSKQISTSSPQDMILGAGHWRWMFKVMFRI
ncbi:MAG: hypothetical protein HQK83_20720, partial [Fibrobacteria bacterium]|nr:hypothetical protein [Fibrobacteria bacterium]